MNIRYLVGVFVLLAGLADCAMGSVYVSSFSRSPGTIYEGDTVTFYAYLAESSYGFTSPYSNGAIYGDTSGATMPSLVTSPGATSSPFSSTTYSSATFQYLHPGTATALVSGTGYFLNYQVTGWGSYWVNEGWGNGHWVTYPIYGYVPQSNSFGQNLTFDVMNVAPTIMDITSDLSVGLGESFNFHANATDPGIDPLTYEWDLDNDGDYDYTGADGSVAFSASGLHTIGLRVSDGNNGYAFGSFDVTADSPNSSIPEPSTLIIWSLLGSLSIVFGRRCRRKAA
jgi:hypothetical protein